MKKIIVFLLILCVVAAALLSTCSLHSSPKTFIIKKRPDEENICAEVCLHELFLLRYILCELNYLI